jgi:hypothetical protein
MMPLCGACAWLFIGTEPPKCLAFPNGIPAEMLNGEWDHNEPIDGDSGVRFTPS